MRWGLLNDTRKLDKQLLTMTVQRFVALASPPQNTLPECPAPKLAIDKAKQQTVIDKFKLNQSSKILALCPGAEFGPAKRWPTEHYAELAKIKLAEGWQVWLFGSDKDQTVAAQINQFTNNGCQDFSGQTTLEEAIDLMSLVELVVSNDSGLMHVAAALDKKLIALYGSSDPGFTPPLNQHAKIIDLNLDCSPCFKRECPLGHLKCLQDIAPSLVLESIDQL